MSRRRSEASKVIDALPGARPPAPVTRISGIRAIADGGVCARCSDPILMDDRIVPAPGHSQGWIHTRCGSGASDE